MRKQNGFLRRQSENTTDRIRNVDTFDTLKSLHLHVQLELKNRKILRCINVKRQTSETRKMRNCENTSPNLLSLRVSAFLLFLLENTNIWQKECEKTKTKLSSLRIVSVVFRFYTSKLQRFNDSSSWTLSSLFVFALSQFVATYR